MTGHVPPQLPHFLLLLYNLSFLFVILISYIHFSLSFLRTLFNIALQNVDDHGSPQLPLFCYFFITILFLFETCSLIHFSVTFSLKTMYHYTSGHHRSCFSTSSSYLFMIPLVLWDTCSCINFLYEFFASPMWYSYSRSGRSWFATASSPLLLLYNHTFFVILFLYPYRTRFSTAFPFLMTTLFLCDTGFYIHFSVSCILDTMYHVSLGCDRSWFSTASYILLLPAELRS